MSRGFLNSVKSMLAAFELERMAVLVEFHDLDLRLWNRPRTIEFGGKTYLGSMATLNEFMLEAKGLSEGLKFQAPSATLELTSLNGWAQAMFINDLFRGDRCSITLLYEAPGNDWTQLGWTTTYACDAETGSANSVIIRLAAVDAVNGTQVPKRTTQAEGCQFEFEVSDDEGGCTFRWNQAVHAAALSTCDRTFATGCKPHFPNVIDPVTGESVPRPKPYGAFLSSIDHKMVPA